MKRVLFLTVFIPSIVFTQDIPSLIYKIALSTDAAHSYQWFHATKDNPMMAPSGHQAWEVNPFIAGRSVEQYEAYNAVVYHLPEIIDMFIENRVVQFLLKTGIALFEIEKVTGNIRLLEKLGFEQRFMIQFSFPL